MQQDAIALSDIEAGMLSDISKQPRRQTKHQPDDNEKPKSKGVIALTVSIPSSEVAYTRIDPNRPKARWKTPEFILYSVLFALVVPYMVWIPYNLSQSSNPNFPRFFWRLSKGWIPGRSVDNSDAQYRSFRSNIPSLLILAGTHLLFGKFYNKIFFSGTIDDFHRIPFHVTFAIFTLFGLHGFSALKVLAIVSSNYAIAKRAPKCGKLGAISGWMFNILILFLNEWYEGYKFASLGSVFSVLDNWKGFYPRWNVSFNITMLRLISFHMDYFWSIQSRSDIPNEGPLSDRQRTSISHEESLYNYWNYLAYTLYTPLYIAGPIMTFNDYIWQMRRPVSVPTSTLRNYGIRFLACLLTMELILHHMYVVAIKDTSAWQGDTPLELSMIGFWNLIVVWLKLLIPWRFFRLWALLDGTDPPENMVRCMANNYSTLAFWRAWHRSYNLWIIRYIYIPVGGGGKSRLQSMLLVFTFVALWHDLSFKLLTWGWLVCLFVLPEVIGKWLISSEKYDERWWYRHLCALGAVFNILLMMIANLVGFVIGVEGIHYMLDQLTGTVKGLRFMFAACACLFIAAQVMFEYREEELRRGVNRKC